MHPGKNTVMMDGVVQCFDSNYLWRLQFSALGSLGARERRADLRRMGMAAKRGSVLSDSC